MSGRYCDAATARQLLGLFEQAMQATSNPLVVVALPIVRSTFRHSEFRSDPCDAELLLQTVAPHDLPPLEAELYAAAISLTAAWWHVETGTDASVALDKTLEHLNRALDHHTPVVLRSRRDGPRAGAGR